MENRGKASSSEPGSRVSALLNLIFEKQGGITSANTLKKSQFQGRKTTEKAHDHKMHNV